MATPPLKTWNPAFCCPECGRAPGRTIELFAWQRLNGHSGEDNWMYFPDGRIRLPEATCINGHVWQPPQPALTITIQTAMEGAS